jgi:hypothetical protein
MAHVGARWTVRFVRVLGVDVPRGWAIVDVTSIGECRAKAFGELTAGKEMSDFVGVAVGYKAEAIAIEAPIEPYIGGRGATGNEGQRRSVLVSLLACSRLAGRFEERADVLSIPSTVVDAATVRRALGIRGKKREELDRAVKAFVSMVALGWPKQSNADERDAAAVAIYFGKQILVKT